MDRFISMWKVRELADKVTNVVMNYTEIEGKVREATSDEAWGPTGQQMQELALATFTYEHFPEVMSMLWRRMLHDNRAHWRRTYKCLLLLSYLVRNGSERVVTSAREHIYDLRSLENYTYVDEVGKDQGINVRHKVRELIDFIQDDEKLREERKKAKKNKDKYIGMSSEAVSMGMRGSSGGWGEYSDRGSTWDEPKERNEEDEYEREDSDGDYGYRKPQKENVYRDTAEVISSSPPKRARPETSDRSERVNNAKPLSISLKSPVKAKPSTPVKKIDLGAAASFGKGASSTTPPIVPQVGKLTHKEQELLDDLFKTCPVPTSGQSSLVLEDEFDPRAEEPKPVKRDSNEFGDFANAFGSAPTSTVPSVPLASIPAIPSVPAMSMPPVAPAQPSSQNNNDGFADFTSAFSGGMSGNDIMSTSGCGPASNLDLLSELSPPPSLAPMGQAEMFSPLDALTGQLANTMLQPNITGDKSKTEEIITQVMNRFIQTIHIIQKIKSENDMKNVKRHFDNLQMYLPGPITVQKLMRVDEILMRNDVLETYSQLITAVIKFLLVDWTNLKEEITKLFILDENFPLSCEILTVLCGFLKSETDPDILQALVVLTLKYVKSDAILTSILDISRLQNDNQDNDKIFNDWENYVHSNFFQGVKYDMSFLSYMLSKVVTNFSMDGNCVAILDFIDIIIYWCSNKYEEKNKFIKRKLIQTLLKHLSRQAIENLGLILLSRAPIDYKSDTHVITNLLGDNIDTSKDWAEILTYKIPFYTRPKDFKNTAIVGNLIHYISTSKNSISILTDLVLRLCRVWADVKISSAQNIHQHMYISELLVLAVKYRVILSVQNNIDYNLIELKSILFKGMSKHLDVLSKEFRCTGMASVEIILKILSDIEKNDTEASNSLNFDYKEMGDACVEIHKILKDLSNKCLIDRDRKIPKDSKYNVIDLKLVLDRIAERVIDADVEARRIRNTVTTCAVKSPEQTKEIVKTIISVKLDALQKYDKEELDSDDDLVPYDMTNDIPVNAGKRPLYLRDLIENIVEAKDAVLFEESLEVSEELVTKQLKGEDSKIATELLDLFVHLEAKYHVDDFDSIKFDTCVAIVCSQPKVCAEYICKEFHTDVGRYSIATKIFMLDVLSEAVNKISNQFDSDNDMKDELHNVNEELSDNNPEELIRQRLLSKTRYFHTKRQHPFAKATVNRFAEVSDSFFYPLVNGFGCKQLSLSRHSLKQDIDNILLFKYLQVVGNVILASKNCPNCRKYCSEILQILVYLRYTQDPKFQSCVISLLASVVLVLPSSVLKFEFFDLILDFRSWLVECLSNIDLTSLRFGGVNSETAIFAGQVLGLIDKALFEDD
ncbi:hypothetical protein K1T71_013443 [Dendrolimus kikuchii]|uniref:Uncharacterized protein n=1 Tax=Dendrolimus kikuchii TaxID=765133 RepID=A0ACC1CGG2_9NEOP|nr:hypothetical protein K1T71_013443 [Dendrolimus kikuchii]